MGSRECLEKPEWMSSPKHCAQLDHTTHVGSLSPRAPRTPSVSGPLAPCPRMTTTSCRTRRPRALCASPFLSLRSALDPHPHPRIGPLPSFFFWGHGRPHASLVERTLSPFLYSPLRSLAQGARHGRLYPHSVNRQCIPSMPSPLPVRCAPSPFATIRCPSSLLFFFIPISLESKAELRDPVVIVKLGSSHRGDGVI